MITHIRIYVYRIPTRVPPCENARPTLGIDRQARAQIRPIAIPKSAQIDQQRAPKPRCQVLRLTTTTVTCRWSHREAARCSAMFYWQPLQQPQGQAAQGPARCCTRLLLLPSSTHAPDKQTTDSTDDALPACLTHHSQQTAHRNSGGKRLPSSHKLTSLAGWDQRPQHACFLPAHAPSSHNPD